jgi:TolB protein
MLYGRERRRNHRLPFSLFIIAVLLALFALVTPARLPSTINPGSVSVPVATATSTALPAPTDVHGGTIVFTCTRQDINQICMVRADGSGYEQLTAGASHSYYPAVSPDGDQIIFAANQYDMFDLYRLAPGVIEGARTRRSRLKRLTDYIGNAFSPSFSPDGKRVVFVNRVAERPAALWTMGSNGEDPHPIYSPPNDVVGAAWAPDGLKVAFAMPVQNSFAYEIFLLDLGNIEAPPQSVPREIRDIGGSISWSPLQEDVLIFAGPAAAREIFRLDLATGKTTQLTFGGNNASPAYSPDGQYIVFNSLRNGGQADLYIMRADGHSMRRLTDHPEPDWQPQWGP